MEFTPLEVNSRKCKTCSQIKAIADFSTKGTRNGKSRLDGICRPCAAKHKRNSRQTRRLKLISLTTSQVFGRQKEEIDLFIESMESEEFYTGLDFILELICDQLWEARDGESSPH